MQAIWQSEHIKFCNWIQQMKLHHDIPDNILVELESGLKTLYRDYSEKTEELKIVILEYKQQQKYIRKQIKASRKLLLQEKVVINLKVSR